VGTKRRKIPHRPIGLTSSAILAWQRGDFRGLAAATGTRPWQYHPWPTRLTALGVDPKDPPENVLSPWNASWQRAVELQAALLEAAGEPPARLMEVS
jgi:hypothetical protein